MQNFKLEYAITDGDIKAVNKRILAFYFTLYFIVALIGIAIGITAVVLRPQTFMLVLGIILLAFGGLLLICALLLLIVPRNFVESAYPTDENPIEVEVGERGITLHKSLISYAVMSGAKLKNGVITVKVINNGIIIIKDAIVSGGTFNELFEQIKAMQGRLTELPPELDPNVEQEPEQNAEQSDGRTDKE